MARVAPIIPAETDLLCEECGYILNGLSDDSNCPECGKPVAESTTRSPRKQDSGKLGFVSFLTTTFAVLFQPGRFFRAFQTRGAITPARVYAWIFYSLCSVLAAVALTQHLSWSMSTGNWLGLDTWFSGLINISWRQAAITAFFVLFVFTPLIVLILLEALTRLAARLTAWEAAYRGLRMPYNAVLRTMYFHAPHYLPATVMVVATVIGYQYAVSNHLLPPGTEIGYLLVLSAEVVIGAIYVFWTYWIAMRSIMFANW